MRDHDRLEDFLIPVAVTLLGVLRTTIQLVTHAPWDADATFGLVVLCLGLLALAGELRRSLRRSH
jgi:hypothetical protein